MGIGFGIGAVTCIDALTLHRRGHLDRIDDLLVAGATAQIAVDRRLDLVTGGVDIGLEEGGADDEESWRAEAALAAAGLGEALLNRMQMMAIRQTLGCSETEFGPASIIAEIEASGAGPCAMTIGPSGQVKAMQIESSLGSVALYNIFCTWSE